MKTGDSVRDGQGNAYQVGNLLGSGLWGKSFLVRRESNDQLFVLKVPLSPGDLRADAPAPESFFAAARECLMEQARLYEQGQVPCLPKLEARFTTPDGQPALLLPRMADSLERRMREGMPVSAVVEVLVAVARQVRQLAQNPAVGSGVHGNLRPSNILFNERGDVVLSDVATPAVRRNIVALAQAAAALSPPSGALGTESPAAHFPPEIAGGQESNWVPVVDTWALAAILWRGVMVGEADFPRRGLDKHLVGALKDKAIDRMKAEDSNPRFHGRLSERVGVLLSRSLSLETSPSPPYRFARLDEFAQRLDEIAALIRPQVTQVGKVMHDRPASKPWFDTDEVVAFSCTVGASVGVEGNEEIGVGIAVFDANTDERLKNLELGYTSDKHPTGRYRFAFKVGGQGGASLVPGRYRVRVAFAIRDSGQPPATAETEIEVRAAPGWVPPPEPPREAPLAFTRETTSLTNPRATTGFSDPSTTPVATLAPDRPAAPAPAVTATAPVTLPPAAPSPATPSLAASAAATPPSRPAAPRPQPLGPAGPSGSAANAPALDTIPGLLGSRPGSMPPRMAEPFRAGNTRELPVDPEPTPAFIARPILPEGSEAPVAPPSRPAASPIASPVPPPHAATVASPDDPPAKMPKNWSMEPIPRGNATGEDRPSTPGVDSPGFDRGDELDDDLDAEPGPIDRLLASVKGDPYVLIMSGIGVTFAILLVAYLALRS